MAKKKSSLWQRLVWIIVILALIIAAVGGYNLYREIYAPNTAASLNKEHYIFIPTGSTFDDVEKIFENEPLLKDTSSFAWVAKTMHYRNNIKPGKYLIKPGMSNRKIINMLRLGLQTPVDVSLNNIHTKQQLAEAVSGQIEASSYTIIQMLNDSLFARSLGFTPANILAFFIPNTYQMYWNTSSAQFMNRMRSAYNAYWTSERRKMAVDIGLTQAQVATLASIVQLESGKEDEKPVIAGVYMNRLRKGWPLQADPTVIYAVGDFTLKRVFSGHREIDSPYNTYKYKGLPPGPICLATTSSLDAVLHYAQHHYMYFCAKDDFSGYHAFAVNEQEQQLNAQRYHAALDRRGIH